MNYGAQTQPFRMDLIFATHIVPGGSMDKARLARCPICQNRIDQHHAEGLEANPAIDVAAVEPDRTLPAEFTNFVQSLDSDFTAPGPAGFDLVGEP